MDLPQAVMTFLKMHDFTEKTVIPFNINGGYRVRKFDFFALRQEIQIGYGREYL